MIIILLENYDVVIVGTGIAGLYTALHLDKSLKILLLTKKAMNHSNSALAQGGIAGVYDKQNDNPKIHYNDTLVAGGHTNDPTALNILVNEAYDNLVQLIDYGVDFDKDSSGNIHLTLEGGHTRARILHHKDSSGKEIIDKLIQQVKTYENIDILENAHVMDIKKCDNTFSFDVLIDGEHFYYYSHIAVIATGGIGRVYEYTTNSSIATGDGIMFAHKLGATIKNLSKVQFHPTAFANRKTRECFLISEAVRGEGAYLRNNKGQRFMEKYDSRMELAPRDVVSKSIILESIETNNNDFFLDITHKDANFIRNRFPMIYKNLYMQGYDLTKDLIPVYPCQHYLMGGIDVDIDGVTTVENLFAVGECSHTGIHGDNRLASNSLLEGVVFAKRAANKINDLLSNITDKTFIKAEFDTDYTGVRLPAGIRTTVRNIMQSAHFVIKDKTRAANGFNDINNLKNMFDNTKFYRNNTYIEAKSLITIAYLIIKDVL